MKHTIKIVGMASVIWAAGPLFGQTGEGSGEQNQIQNRNQVQQETSVRVQDQEQLQEQARIQEQVRNQLGSVADDLMQLRLRYREQTMLLLKEREQLVQRYRNASETEQAEIREQLREQQHTIAETHRELRASIRRELREIRAERMNQMRNGTGGNSGG